MRDDLAARLLATFLEELDDQAGVMLGELRALESDPTDEERLKALFRVLHTLKGAARVAGVPSIEQACHALETDLVKLSPRGRRMRENMRPRAACRPPGPGAAAILPSTDPT